jgi:hypothetical protein
MCPNVTLFTTNTTCTALGVKLCLHSKKLATNYLFYDTATAGALIMGSLWFVNKLQDCVCVKSIVVFYNVGECH